MNKILRIYVNEDPPSFSLEGLRIASHRKDIDIEERFVFQEVYHKALRAILDEGIHSDQILGYVDPHTGKLLLLKNNLCVVPSNAHEVEMSLEEVTSIAFDPKTDDDIAIHYQEKLRAAFKMIDGDPDYWHRIIFLEDISTGKLQIWFD